MDHVVIGIRDLAGGTGALEAAGFRVAGGGVHAGRGTANELVRLTSGYLELLGVVDREQAMAHGGSRRQAAEFLNVVPAGPLGFAVEVADLDDCQQRLRQAGVPTSGPHAMARVQPDGRRVSWRTLLVEDRQWLTPYPFLIQWDTGVDRWAGAPDSHPNGVTHVSGVVVSAASPDDTLAVYEALGAIAIAETDDGHSLTLADISVEVRPASTDSDGAGELRGAYLSGGQAQESACLLRGALGDSFLN